MKIIALICFSSLCLAIGTIQISQHNGNVLPTSLAPQAEHVEVWIARDSLESDNILHIGYQCSNASLIFVKLQVHTESQANFPIFRKEFGCLPSGKKRLKVITLKYARYITFKPSFYNKYSIFLDNATLRIWMTDLDKKWTTYERAKVKTEVPLKVILPFDRPDWIPNKCFVWWYELLSKLPYSPTCPQEEEVVHILSYPMALDGGRVGLVKEFSPYKSKMLERTRMNSVRNANFSVVFWVYIVEYCPHSTHCSLMHHATWDDEYLTPVILINRKGQIHVEVILRKGESLAYLTLEDFVLPRKEWVQLVFTCHMSNVWQLHMKTAFDRWKTTTIQIPNSAAVYHYDVRGVYYFGGSELQPSFRGYFGEIIFFRRRVIDPFRMSQDRTKLFFFELQFKERDAKCQRYRNKISFIKMHAESLQQAITSKKSCPGFIKWLRDKNEKSELPQCKLEQAPKLSHQYAFVKRLIHGWVFTNQKNKMSEVAPFLVKQAYTILDENGLDGVSEVISLLKQSSCLGNHDASFMLATIINYGLFIEVDLKQSHSYLLTGGIYSNRLCLLSLANKHVFGLDGIPVDYEQAYVYYMNGAYLTKDDLLRHDDRDTITEAVRLTDEVLLKAQTSEDEDLFLWLKYQASKGMIDAQRKLAGMLYWGSQGVKRNTSSASSYYEAAASSGDATALYDYGILLLKGHGVKQNITKALHHFEMAAEKRHAQAINTLGWYALVYKKNYTEAANYFEEAFKLGNPDAGHNLAHMLLSGIFPDLKRVERVLAWDFFSKAALGGNFDSGLLVARYNMIGHPRTIRTPSLSIEWARYLAEQNPVIGRLLRSGLTHFRKQNWPVALVYYLMAASTGVEVANFNLAFLCEENYDYLTSSMQKECTWRHYNLSALRSSQSSNPYAWLKMADYHYMNHNVSLAANTYAEAAAQGDPQGYFSLATMIENKDKVPDKAFKTLGISFATSRNVEELLYHLYSRCKNSQKSDAFVPCSLALFKIKIYYFWIHHSTKVIGFVIPLFIIAFISASSRVLSYFRNSPSLF